MTDEVAAAAVGVGRLHPHLPQAVDRVAAHGQERRARPVVEVREVVVEAAALLDVQAEGGVERLLAGAADPEEAVALLLHPDQALLEDAGLEHDVVHLKQERVGQRVALRFGPGVDSRGHVAHELRSITEGAAAQAGVGRR